MKKDICQKFLDFKLRHSLSNEVIVKMVTEYANSELDMARTHYSEKYKISNYTFYKSRDYAVIFCLVDNEICKRLKNKSATNCRLNNDKNSSRASTAHYTDLLAERQNFLDSFTINEIKDIAIKYVSGISIEKIAIAYETGDFAIKYLLKKGITSLVLDANIVKAINSIVGDSLSDILKIRERNKSLLLNCINNHIVFLKSQIDCYDLYFRNFANKPDLEDLKKQLSNVIEYQKEVLQL